MSSASQDQYLVGVGEEARRARDGASRGAELDSLPSVLRLGRVTAANGNTYTVEILSASGAVADTLAGVPSWGGTHNVGARVVVAWIGDRPIPVIWSSGGGCSIPAHGHTSSTDGGLIGFLG